MFSNNAAVVPRIPPAVFLLTGAIGIIGSNSLVLAPIAPEVAEGFAVTVQRVMAASATFGLGTAASALFLARHIDRFGAWRSLRFSFAAITAAMALSAAAPFAWVLIAAQLIAGLAAGVALPAIYANATAIAPAGRENETVGIVLTGWTLSLVAGVSLSAVLADLMHWRAVYAVVGMLSLAGLVTFIFNRGSDKVSSQPALSPLAALSIKGVLPLLVACGLFMAGFYGAYAYLGDHVTQALGHSVSANGLLTVLYGAGFGGAVMLDGVVQRFNARLVLPLAFLAVAASCAAMALLSASYVALLLCVFLWGLFNHFGLNTLIVRLGGIDAARRGAVLGLNSATTYLAAFGGTLAFGPVYAAVGFSGAAYLAASLTLLAALASWR